MGVMMLFTLIGAVDDWEGVRGKRRGLGMRARTKFALQSVIALAAAIGLYYFLEVDQLYVPNVKGEVEIWALIYIPIAAFIIVAKSNAVNFTDGLDGMAGLISATAFAAYGGIALLQGQSFVAAVLFYRGGRFVWLSLVQCPPGAVIHG